MTYAVVAVAEIVVIQNAKTCNAIPKLKYKPNIILDNVY